MAEKVGDKEITGIVALSVGAKFILHSLDGSIFMAVSPVQDIYIGLPEFTVVVDSVPTSTKLL